jgi:hypothetical protein
VCLRRLPSSGMLRSVASVRTDVTEEVVNSIIRMTRIGKSGKTLAVLSYRSMLLTLFLARRFLSVTLMMEAIRSSKMSVLTRTKHRNIPGAGILQFINMLDYFSIFLKYCLLPRVLYVIPI